MSLLILMTYYEDLIMLKNSFIMEDEHNEKLLNMYSLQLATDWLHRNTTWLAFIAKPYVQFSVYNTVIDVNNITWLALISSQRDCHA